MRIMKRTRPSTPASNWEQFLPTPPAHQTLLLKDAITSWQARLERDACPSRYSYSSNLRQFDELWGTRPCASISSEVIVAFLRYRTHYGYAAKTVRRDLYVLSGLLEHALELGAIDSNPVLLVPKKEIPRNRVIDPARSRMEVLEPEQIDSLIHDHRLPLQRRAFWAILLMTGARPGEAAALARGDWTIDVAPLSSLKIERAWHAKARAIQATKTDLVRYVPVHPELRAILEEALAERGEVTRHDPIAPYRVPRSGGESHVWYQRQALKAWHRDLDVLSIPHPPTGDRRLYATRHTFITQLAKHGADVRAIEQMTHSSAAPDGKREGTSIRAYLHDLGWEELCAAVLKFPVRRAA